MSHVIKRALSILQKDEAAIFARFFVNYAKSCPRFHLLPQLDFSNTNLCRRDAIYSRKASKFSLKEVSFRWLQQRRKQTEKIGTMPLRKPLAISSFFWRSVAEKTIQAPLSCS